MSLHDTSLPTGGGPSGTFPVGILKNTAIAFSPLTLHRREDLYPLSSSSLSPVSAFDPSRWDSWRPASTWNYIPFNAGPRTCIGQEFARTKIAYTVVRLLQTLEKIEGRMGAERQFFRTDVVLQPGAGVKVALGRRGVCGLKSEV
jgi:cytochrome P450